MMNRNLNIDITQIMNILEFKLRKVENVYPKWYVEEGGTFCSCCGLAYDFIDSYKALLICRAKGQPRGPRCIKCGRILRTRSKPNPKSGFWKRVDELERRMTNETPER